MPTETLDEFRYVKSLPFGARQMVVPTVRASVGPIGPRLAITFLSKLFKKTVFRGQIDVYPLLEYSGSHEKTGEHLGSNYGLVAKESKVVLQSIGPSVHYCIS